MEITEGIMVAIITGVFAVFGQWIISRKSRELDEIKRAVMDERTSQRLQTIEDKLEVHNHYAEKIGAIQTDIATIRTDLQNLKERTEK